MSEIVYIPKIKHNCEKHDIVSVALPYGQQIPLPFMKKETTSVDIIIDHSEGELIVEIHTQKLDQDPAWKDFDIDEDPEDFDHTDNGECLAPKCYYCFRKLTDTFFKNIIEQLKPIPLKDMTSFLNSFELDTQIPNGLDSFFPIQFDFQYTDPTCIKQNMTENTSVNIGDMNSGPDETLNEIVDEILFSETKTLTLNIISLVESRIQVTKTFEQLNTHDLLKWIASCLFEIAMDQSDISKEMDSNELRISGIPIDLMEIKEIIYQPNNHVYFTLFLCNHNTFHLTFYNFANVPFPSYEYFPSSKNVMLKSGSVTTQTPLLYLKIKSFHLQTAADICCFPLTIIFPPETTTVFSCSPFVIDDIPQLIGILVSKKENFGSSSSVSETVSSPKAVLTLFASLNKATIFNFWSKLMF